MALLDLLGFGGGAAMPDPNNNGLLDQSALQRLLRLLSTPGQGPQIPAAWPQRSQVPPAAGYGGGLSTSPNYRMDPSSAAAAPAPNLAPLPNLPPPPGQPLLSGAAAMPLPAQPGPLPSLGGLLGPQRAANAFPGMGLSLPDWLTQPFSMRPPAGTAGPAAPDYTWGLNQGMGSGSGVAPGYQGVSPDYTSTRSEPRLERPYPMEGRDIGRRQDRALAQLEDRPPPAGGPGGAPAAQQPLLSKIDDFLHRNADTMLALAGGFGGARSIGQGIGRAGQLMLAGDTGAKGLTEQALIARGVDPAEARALASNPTLLKERLPELYPQPKFEKITDAQGNERFVLHWPSGAQTEPMEISEGTMRQMDGRTYIWTGGKWKQANAPR